MAIEYNAQRLQLCSKSVAKGRIISICILLIKVSKLVVVHTSQI